MRRPLRPLLLAVALLGGACASVRVEGDTIHGKDFAFRIGTPPGSWQRIEISHAAIAFRDERDGATVFVNARCGLDGEDVPLEALTQHLFMRFTDREILEQRVVPFDHREALRTILAAKLDGVPMQFEVWVLKKDGCVYDFAYMAAPPTFKRGAEEFERFVKGFATVSAHAD